MESAQIQHRTVRVRALEGSVMCSYAGK